MEIPKEILLFAIGAIAGFMNVFAGGGSTLTLPVLIFAGLDAATANGTNRIAIFLQNVSGISSFKNQKITGARIALKYSLFTIPGAIIGAFYSIKIDDVWFERILGIVMIGVVISLFQKRKGNPGLNETEKPGFFFYLSLFAIGFYGGFIQVGIGFIIMGTLFHFLQTSLVRVNFYKLILVLIYTIPTILVFVFNDKINWALGLSLAAGNMLGAWIAAHVTVKKGDKFIRYILAVAIILMAIKLFL
ncbi:MAG: sulfite exporter TauE/SafE family protein [Calditrichaeota bacterium]|nr:MAG: sulfite exporter TauE/SafE family protein [Calditrichota bacterium]MBL1206615.1 sulfite exporter TauE/SafE family protein [Calditrichota bacterium]NOG46442.1 sulfite exporter TauE/SafE family protein [Calditrichota bacterium]